MRALALVAFVLSFVLAAPSVRAQQPSPAPQQPAPAPSPTAPDQATKDEARARFDRGLAHFDRGEWSAALAEFLSSRSIFPTRVATKNAAVCLRKEGRFDEALEMYEALLREFPDLPPADKQFADREIEELRGSIGTLEISGAEAGADIVVDGRGRGTYPLSAPLRVSAGSHVVRVYKSGFLPFEARIDVAGRQNAVVSARLAALTQGGRLRVTDQGGRTLDVVVDNVVVGKTPWEGSLAVGEHVVALRGEGNLGTQPVSTPVILNQTTPLTLNAEELEASTRIDPTPGGASVRLDGVTVGRGVWEGKLRVGAHRIEVAAEGFLPAQRDLRLEKGQREVLVVKLEIDPSSPMWTAKHPSVFVIEIDGALALSTGLGGDIAGCSGGCSAGLPLGAKGLLHGGYQLGSGLGFSIDAGYAALFATVSDRSTNVLPRNRPLNAGTATDKLRLSGLLLGASAFYHRGDVWPLTLRLGIGAFLGSVKDTRTGTFTTSSISVPPNAPYNVNLTESESGTFLYVVPEVRIGRRLGEHFELSVGVEAMVLTALSTPKWGDKNLIVASPTPLTAQGDGQGGFGSQTLTGSFVLVLAPGIGARYEF